jgi:hypothetical protein
MRKDVSANEYLLKAKNKKGALEFSAIGKKNDKKSTKKSMSAPCASEPLSPIVGKQ